MTASRLLLLSFLAFASAAARSETFSFPDAENPLFSVDIPGDWKPKASKEGRLEASSPNDDAYVALWVLKEKDALGKLEEDVREIAESALKDIRLSEKETRAEIDGMDVLFFEGTGVDREDGDKVQFEICLFSPAEKKLGVVYLEYNEDAAEKRIPQMTKIVRSIRKGK